TVLKTLTIVHTATGKKNYVCDMNPLLRQLEKFDEEIDVQEIEQLSVSREEDRIQFTYHNSTYLYEINEGKLTLLRKNNPTRTGETMSANGKYVAYVKDSNVFVRDVDTVEVIQLTTDGRRYDDYGSHAESNNLAVTQQQTKEELPPGIIWSPTSNKLLTYKLDQEQVEELHVIQSAREEGEPIRPRLFTYRYPFAGDCVPEAQLYMCDIEDETCDKVPVDPLFINFTPPFTSDYQKVLWSEDGKQLFVPWISRDFKQMKGIVVDTETLEARTIITEESDTFLFVD